MVRAKATSHFGGERRGCRIARSRGPGISSMRPDNPRGLGAPVSPGTHEIAGSNPASPTIPPFSGMIKNRAVPALAVRDAESALAFYAKAFGAKEVSERIPWEGKIGHAEIEIEGAQVMLADEFPTYNKSPKTLGGTPVIIHVDVKDVDSFFKPADAAGATVRQSIKNEPYGRICKLQDPFGHQWFFNTGPNQRR